MKMELIAKGFNEQNNLSAVMEKKLARLERHFSREMEAKVVVKHMRGDNFDLEITLFQKGMPVPARAETVTTNVYESVDVLLKKLEKQLVKFRSRQESKKKARVELPLVEKVDEEEKAKFGRVVKVKNFEISIVSVEDAIEEMELLDHTFHLFVNAENNKVSLVYKRNDNDYGLISPEY